MWQTSRFTIHNLRYEFKVKIHDYNTCCTYQLPCLNTAAAGAAAGAGAAAVSDTDSVAGDQQFVLRPAVVG
jgi:hypothetical protein